MDTTRPRGFSAAETAIAHKIEDLANLPRDAIRDSTDGYGDPIVTVDGTSMRFEPSSFAWGLSHVASEFGIRIPELNAAIAAEEGWDEDAAQAHVEGAVA